MSKTAEELSKETASLNNGALTTDNVPASPAATASQPERPSLTNRPRAVLFVNPDHAQVVPPTMGMSQLAIESHASGLFVARVVPSRDGEGFSIVPFLPGQQGDADEYAVPLDHAREMGVISVVGPASVKLLPQLLRVQMRTLGDHEPAIGVEAAGAEVLIGTQYAGYSSGIAAHFSGLRGQVDWARATSRRVASAMRDVLGPETEVTYVPGPRMRQLTPEAARTAVPSRDVITMLTRDAGYAQELVDRATADRSTERGQARTAERLGVKTTGIQPLSSAPSNSLTGR